MKNEDKYYFNSFLEKLSELISRKQLINISARVAEWLRRWT
jgi:hypothetical protein